ncbi:MAG: acyl-CoA synthetase [Nitrospirae bacterium GWC2_42_7]|nr:MAG: acyl-CoA synthetase [Nitrospirae bacterium GWC2_42_7]
MLDPLFYPKSVAIIGASADPGKVGHSIVNNLKRFNYKGNIYPINPKSTEILGLKAFKSIFEIKDNIDLAVIVIPAAFVPSVVRDCVTKGIKSAVIISAGFKEAGSAGIILEEEIKSIAAKGDIRILGPNCLGVMNTSNSLNATFAAGMLPKGRLSFFSQSGALGIAILDWAIGNKVGFSKFISLGNKADLNETDFIEYFINDPETDVILGYIEDVVDGKRFLEVARKATKVKPVILVKSGGTQAGARAASSHTGALAGSENAFNAAFKQTGVIRADGIEDLFEAAMAFNSNKLPKGNNLLIITNAGGPGIIAADTAEKLGINLPQLSKDTVRTLSSLLPKNASLYNPVDIIGDATSERYADAIDNAVNDPNINGILIILTPQAVINVEDTARLVVNASKKSDMPFITSFMGWERVRSAVEYLKSSSIPNFSYPEPAVKAFKRLFDHWAWTKKEEPMKNAISSKSEKVSARIAEAIDANRLQFAEDSSREILSEYGFEFPEKYLAESHSDAASSAAKIGFPVVMKISSPDILHKTDIGGVKIGINSPNEAEDAFADITMNAKKFMPDAFIDGVLVYRMVPKGKEVILGITYDRTFGHMIMFGLGGIYVEVLKDVSFRIVPVSRADAFEMIQEIRSFQLLKGARGEKPADIESIADAITRLSQLSLDFPMIQELDINPPVVYEKGSMALDARIIISSDHKGGTG